MSSMNRMLLATLLCAAACSATPSSGVLSPSVSGNPTTTAAPTAEPTAGASASPDPSPAREPVNDYEFRAHALGPLTGNWIFVGKRAPTPAHRGTAENQIWAIPLAGGPPRLALAYEIPTAGSPEGTFDNAPYLRRQFSPDGTRIVVAGRLVDLVTGQTTPLPGVGKFPAWSKDGSRIAFFYELPFAGFVPPDYGVGVMSAAGGPVTHLASVGYQVGALEWSPDGSMLIVSQPDGITVVDAMSGKATRHLAEFASHGPSFAHWRTATPQLAVATGKCDGTTNTRLITLGDVMAPAQTLRETRERCPALSVRDPRWNPAVASELLYVATRANAGAMPHEYRVHLLDTASGRDTTLPLSAYEATWTWDGSAIAYVANAGSDSYGGSIRLWRRDGSGERVLMNASESESFFSIASLSY
jgi:hypothetical protein